MHAEYTLVESPLGAVGLAWTASGVAGVLLPFAAPALTLAALKRRFPGGTSRCDPQHHPAAAFAARELGRYLNGRPSNLDAIALDDGHLPDFARRVYATTRAIPLGETRTYGELAGLLGSPHGARAVGQALGRNPYAVVIPCHRVLARGNAAGGFSAPGGLDTKAKLLALEGKTLPWQPNLFHPS